MIKKDTFALNFIHIFMESKKNIKDEIFCYINRYKTIALIHINCYKDKVLKGVACISTICVLLYLSFTFCDAHKDSIIGIIGAYISFMSLLIAIAINWKSKEQINLIERLTYENIIHTVMGKDFDTFSSKEIANLKDCVKKIGKNPSTATEFFILGYYDLEFNKEKNGEDYFYQALTRNYNNGEYYYYYAFVLDLNGKEKEALGLMEIADRALNCEKAKDWRKRYYSESKSKKKNDTQNISDLEY